MKREWVIGIDPDSFLDSGSRDPESETDLKQNVETQPKKKEKDFLKKRETGTSWVVEIDLIKMSIRRSEIEKREREKERKKEREKMVQVIIAKCSRDAAEKSRNFALDK